MEMLHFLSSAFSFPSMLGCQWTISFFLIVLMLLLILAVDMPAVGTASNCVTGNKALV